MLKLFERFKKKIVMKANSTLQEIQIRCKTDRVIEGFYKNHAFRLLLFFRNGDQLKEITDGAPRFNEESHVGTIAFWLSSAHLGEYLRRRQENYDFVQKGGKSRYPPHSPEQLALSAVCVADFNLNRIWSMIDHVADEFIQRGDSLPTLPSMIPYASDRPFCLYLKIAWNP